jgi:hypothetical protein
MGFAGRLRTSCPRRLVTTWIDGDGQKVYFDDLTYTARQE